MEIIPAIDIIKGRCVRLTKGDYRFKKVYSKNPLKIAKIFQKAGFKKLHLIDLEGAKEGKIKNWKTIEKIAKNTSLLIEFGGGIRDERDIKKLISLGINKVILGSSLLKDPEKAKKFLKKYKEKIIVAVDLKRDKIYYRGWQEKAKKELSSFLRDLIKSGVETIICTDIERDGTLKGPNFSLYKKLTKNFPEFKIIASGGVRNKEDLEKLSKIGVFGIIIGKAIYEKTIFLDELKSMMPKKIIPCLDIENNKVVKGIKFEDLRLVGDPVRLATKYSEEGADELAMLDISASQERRKPFFDLVKKVAKAIKPRASPARFARRGRGISSRQGKIPLIVGGGIATLSDIEKLLKLGVSKVSLNTSIVKNPEFLTRAVKKFGSKRIVVAIDVKRHGKTWRVCILGGKKETELDAIKWAKEVKKRGAGELLPTSKDRDGTQKGYDLGLLRKLKEVTGLPVIASGGAGKKEHFLEAFKEGKVNAALAAGIFHFGKIKIPELKKYLKQRGINVNLPYKIL